MNFLNNLFGWGKWELYKEDIPYTKITYSSPLLGSREIQRTKVTVDIYYKENKSTGLKKYKKVVKE